MSHSKTINVCRFAVIHFILLYPFAYAHGTQVILHVGNDFKPYSNDYYSIDAVALFDSKSGNNVLEHQNLSVSKSVSAVSFCSPLSILFFSFLPKLS